MIATALRPAAAQAPGGPTVGDTIWIARTVALPDGATLRATDWDPPDPVERIGPPQVTPRGDSVTVAYPIVVWRAGTLTVSVPGPVLLRSDGRVDSLAAASVPVTIRSVLPAVPLDSAIAPQPRAEFVPRTTETLLPLALLLVAAALLLAPLHWWWRRRGRPRPAFVLPPLSGGPPLDRWADAGESRAVAAVAATRLRAAIAAAMPAAHPGLDTAALLEVVRARLDWPLAQLGELLRALDAARFGVEGHPDALGLARQADELGPRLRREIA
jgi:hypothetical protein